MRRLLACVGVALAAAPASAHHGWSEYDAAKVTELAGAIVESGYEHPHGHIRLQVPGRIWHVVLAPPTRMLNRGLPASQLKPGSTVTVVGYPSRSKPGELRAERIVAGGKKVELR
jgi:hypothetical protein